MDVSLAPEGAAELQGQVVQGGGQLPGVIGGQTFCDFHRQLHLFQLISNVIKPARCNFLPSYHVIYAQFRLYTVLHTHVAISLSEMHDFSLRDLHTFCVCIMLKKIISPKLDVTKILLKVYMNMFTVPNLTVQPGSLLGRYM